MAADVEIVAGRECGRCSAEAAQAADSEWDGRFCGVVMAGEGDAAGSGNGAILPNELVRFCGD